MPDNPPPAMPLPGTFVATGFHALPDHRILELSGRDAIAFAQAQFMSDVGALAAGHWHWSGWLTPKGRVIALFAQLRLDDETLWLLLPDADPPALAERMRGFVFRSKLALTPRGDLSVTGAMSLADQARGPAFAGDVANGLELDYSAEAGQRTLRVRQGPCPTSGSLAGIATWRSSDMAHGLPRLAPSQSELWTPQQLSLQRLQAYSVKKGCYPGQEIVARTHFLGQAKRGLALLEADTAIAADADVEAQASPIGKVVCVEGRACLAVLPLGAEIPGLQVAGLPVRQRPLLGGLAR